MSRPLIECWAQVWRVGKPPFHEKPDLRFREDRQLQDQLAGIAKHHWFKDADIRTIKVEVRRKTVNKVLDISGKIDVAGATVAEFKLFAHANEAHDGALRVRA